jgi:NAD(P)-dependent dehydrogenase (short-subunit alcohol dehydrogenase family)
MSEILRPGLLAGVTVRLEHLGAAPDPGLLEALTQLGAEVGRGQLAGADALVLDCSTWSPAGDEPGPGGAEPLLELLDGVWSGVLAAAVDGFIPGGHGGRIVFIAPAVIAAAAALENLSRTLSVEWARHSITALTLVPGIDTDPVHLATVVAYLLSPAGAYFSGARLDLDLLGR